MAYKRLLGIVEGTGELYDGDNPIAESAYTLRVFELVAHTDGPSSPIIEVAGSKRVEGQLAVPAEIEMHPRASYKLRVSGSVQLGFYLSPTPVRGVYSIRPDGQAIPEDWPSS